MTAVNWSCSFAPHPERITVGQELELKCLGPTAGLSPQTLQFLFDEPRSYTLVWLRTKSWQADEAIGIVTSYRTGTHSLMGLSLQSAGAAESASSVKLDAGSLVVQSVIHPQQPVSEPFGPLGPFVLSVPIIVWIAAGTLLTLALVLLGVLIGRRWSRRRWQKEILKSREANPLAAFHRALRRLTRKPIWDAGGEILDERGPANFVSDLKKLFLLYLTHELIIPADRWTVKTSLRELKRQRRALYQAEGESLRKLWLELNEAALRGETLTRLDCEQLLLWCRELSERISEFNEKSRGSAPAPLRTP